MKRVVKNIIIPIHLWTHTDLSVFEKVVLIELDSYADSEGCPVGVQTISSATGLPVKTIKETLKSLQIKGAIEVRIDGDGAKRVIPLLYKERYIENPNAVVIGDKPTDIEQIDYQLIQDTWNEYCGNLSKLDRFTARRKQKTRTCLKGASATQSDMIKVIKLVATSSFLNGSKTEWKCGYDWIIKSPDNFTKIIEGQYHKDYNERNQYDAIMRGGEIKARQNENEDFYR